MMLKSSLYTCLVVLSFSQMCGASPGLDGLAVVAAEHRAARQQAERDSNATRIELPKEKEPSLLEDARSMTGWVFDSIVILAIFEAGLKSS